MNMNEIEAEANKKAEEYQIDFCGHCKTRDDVICERMLCTEMLNTIKAFEIAYIQGYDLPFSVRI